MHITRFTAGGLVQSSAMGWKILPALDGYRRSEEGKMKSSRKAAREKSWSEKLAHLRENFTNREGRTGGEFAGQANIFTLRSARQLSQCPSVSLEETIRGALCRPLPEESAIVGRPVRNTRGVAYVPHKGKQRKSRATGSFPLAQSSCAPLGGGVPLKKSSLDAWEQEGGDRKLPPRALYCSTTTALYSPGKGAVTIEG